MDTALEFGIESSNPISIVSQFSRIYRPYRCKAPIKRAAAEAERLGRLAYVAVEARHRLLDQEALDVLEAHFLEARRRVAAYAQSELAQADAVPCAISTPRSTA